MKNRIMTVRAILTDIVDWARAVLHVLAVAVTVEAGVTSTVQRFACPSMTGTRVFLDLPNSFLWKFKALSQ